MNEKIKLLAEQAAKKHGHTIKFSPEITETLDSFAELIVGGCVDIAQEYDGAKLGGPGLIIAMRIESHFGVEE